MCSSAVLKPSLCCQPSSPSIPITLFPCKMKILHPFVTKWNWGLLAPHIAKPINWHWIMVKESTVLVWRGQARRIVSSCLKDLNRGDFQKWVFKGNIRGEGCRCMISWRTSDWLVVTGWCFRNSNHHLLVPTHLGSTCSRHPPPGRGGKGS